MKQCEQTKGQSIYQHGISVANYLAALIDLLNGLPISFFIDEKYTSEVIKLPKWFYEEKDLILKNLFSWEILEEYAKNHDIGKPFCLEIDKNGKRHFPNHAEISYQIYLKYFKNEKIANLIRMDMDIHTLKSNEIDEFASRPEAISLLITGLAEVLSNSSLFGGVESTSFKIKFKHIEKRGNQILAIIKGAKP